VDDGHKSEIVIASATHCTIEVSHVEKNSIENGQFQLLARLILTNSARGFRRAAGFFRRRSNSARGKRRPKLPAVDAAANRNGDSADVILMAVREDEASHRWAAFCSKLRESRSDDVNA